MTPYWLIVPATIVALLVIGIAVATAVIVSRRQD
jgi:hypothetical protein